MRYNCSFSSAKDRIPKLWKIIHNISLLIDIAKIIEEVVTRIPLKSRYNPSSIKHPSVTEFLRIPKKRWEDIRQNPAILDQSQKSMTQ